MNTTTFNVPSIHCMHCVHTIKMELSELPGIKSVEGDHDKKTIAVQFEPPATIEQIEKLLAEINYPVQK